MVFGACGTKNAKTVAEQMSEAPSRKHPDCPRKGFVVTVYVLEAVWQNESKPGPIWQNEPNLDFMRHHLHIGVLG